MPFTWFRRRKADQEQAPAQAAAPAQRVVPTDPPPASEPAATATESDAAARKRRRGTRGGRGRKKPGTAAKTETAAKAETAKAETTAKPERKPSERAKPAPVRSQAEERRLQQRKERKDRGERRRREPPRRAALPEAKRELLVSVDVGEQRVAVLEDDRVAEVYLERPERRSIAGNIYLGTVDNVLPGMEAAFVEIGLEKNGFLYVDEIVVPELEGKRHGKKIQELISKGEEILVQAVKDPMKTKGARLTTEISLPGRFVVFVPNGEGTGVSRRVEDEERSRLKDIVKHIALPDGGLIVRTAAEGASAEDIERDVVFLQRLWKSIQARAKDAKPPTLVYQEAELPLRVVRDLFTGDFERALVDDERTFKRIVGYLKKTSPHMVDRVVRYKEKPPLMEAYGVDAAINSTLSRRVDLPSGGYLIFDYAEAFTVIDVNTGRFVGSRSKTSGARLEDTITKNNLEAVKEVVRQLRLRDVGGIIVIDFIDMANPKNRETVEEALRNELARDRTKTYVVEISPLGLVEMTRQNVTDGPREILTRKCPTCSGDGIVISEYTAAIELERRLKALAAGSRSQAFRVEVAARPGALLIGPGASRLTELEARTKKRFLLELKDGVHLDHLLVDGEGKLEELQPEAPAAEGTEVEVKLVEVGLHDPEAGVGKLDGLDVCVAGAAKQVGKKLKVRIERVLDGTGYAVPVGGRKDGAQEPITAEGEAEKPTRKPPARKAAAGSEVEVEVEPEAVAEIDVDAAAADDDEPADEAGDGEPELGADGAPKKRTRRGSRGGRGRKRKPTDAVAENGDAPAADSPPVAEPEAAANGPADPEAVPSPRIHVPDADLGEDGDGDGDAPSANGDAAAPKKRTRRGSRGGRNRKRPAAAGDAGDAATTDAEADQPVPVLQSTPEPEPEPAPDPEPEPAAESDVEATEAGYVPMSEWIDDFDRGRR